MTSFHLHDSAVNKQRNLQKIKYHAIDHAAYKFQPVAIETFDAYGGEAWDFIQQLGCRLRLDRFRGLSFSVFDVGMWGSEQSTI
jgi:hypothetical protein